MKRLVNILLLTFLCIPYFTFGWALSDNIYLVTFNDGRTCEMETKTFTDNWSPVRKQEGVVRFFFIPDAIYYRNMETIRNAGVEDMIVDSKLAIGTWDLISDGYIALKEVLDIIQISHNGNKIHPTLF